MGDSLLTSEDCHSSSVEVEEVSTHKSAKTNTGSLFVTDLNFWFFDPKINVFPGLVMDHLYVQFGDPSCIVFWDIV